MAKHENVLLKILRGTADANIAFADLCGLLRHLGFTERTRGSNHIFTRAGIEERITLQRDQNKAEVYQVRQVRAIILKYKLGEEE
ncbi:MAG: type II toxin-antitoxin system HicA family toxin [Gemmatimonadetes bacterium]|nr:type II toxin-antitoxin system HicA family toxin [Gemmatimonadota bacterium]